MIPKRESELKSEFLRELDRQTGTRYFHVLHADMSKSGIPDLSISGLGKTSWYEFKHATPRYRSPGIQEYTCQRLALTSYCRYIFFVETEDDECIIIAHPKEVSGRQGRLPSVYERVIVGHNMRLLSHFIRTIHEHQR